MNFEYFFIDRNIIIYCMQSLKNDIQIQWFSHIDNDKQLKKIFYSKFKKFLLNLITNSANRRFFVYKRWMKIEQKFDQKITTFKIYLKQFSNAHNSMTKMKILNIISIVKISKIIKMISRTISITIRIKTILIIKIILIKNFMKIRIIKIIDMIIFIFLIKISIIILWRFSI